MNSGKQQEHNLKVQTYFDKASTVFDTFYDRKRTAFMQWVDRKFRSDVFVRYRMTFEAVEPLKDKTIFDVGCGSGPYVVEAARRGCKLAVGLDMAGGMLDLAQRRASAAGVADRCRFILGTFPQDSPEMIFDHAIVMGVMDYIANPLEFLSALARKIKLSAVVSCPSIHWLRTPLRKVRYRLKRCPVYFYEPHQIEELAEAAGFSNVEIKKIPGAGMDYFVTLFK